VSGASSGRGEARRIKDALLARETVEQVDDFGRVKAQRVESAASTTLSALAERLNDGRLPDRWSPIWRANPQAVRSGPATVPSGASADRDTASRERGLRLYPQLPRIPAEMRPELTRVEIAMRGSYFDDVLRDPRRYSIENTAGKVRRPGTVRRSRDAVCTERIFG
jgi:hypothetical protein